MLDNNKDDDLVIDNFPQFVVANVQVNALLEQVQELSKPKSSEMKNVKALQQMIDGLVNTKNCWTFSRAEIFGAPVSIKIAPNYYNVIPRPMCILFIRMRLIVNYNLSQDVLNDGFGESNIQFHSYNGANYGSMLDQKELFFDQSCSLDQAKKDLKQLTLRPPPYYCLSEIIGDLLTICANCCYFNAGDEAMIKQGVSLKDDIIRVVSDQFESSVPQWVETCCDIQNLKMMINEQQSNKIALDE